MYRFIYYASFLFIVYIYYCFFNFDVFRTIEIHGADELLGSLQAELQAPEDRSVLSSASMSRPTRPGQRAKTTSNRKFESSDGPI